MTIAVKKREPPGWRPPRDPPGPNPEHNDNSPPPPLPVAEDPPGGPFRSPTSNIYNHTHTATVPKHPPSPHPLSPSTSDSHASGSDGANPGYCLPLATSWIRPSNLRFPNTTTTPPPPCPIVLRHSAGDWTGSDPLGRLSAVDDPLEGGPCYQLYTREFYTLCRDQAPVSVASEATSPPPPPH